MDVGVLVIFVKTNVHLGTDTSANPIATGLGVIAKHTVKGYQHPIQHPPRRRILVTMGRMAAIC
jgi:hypothetical protein